MHVPTGTLIATDLVWNYPSTGVGNRVKLWKFGMDRVYLPFYKRFMIADKGVFDTFDIGSASRLRNSCQVSS